MNNLTWNWTFCGKWQILIEFLDSYDNWLCNRFIFNRKNLSMSKILLIDEPAYNKTWISL